METFIFKTNIANSHHAKKLKPLLQQFPSITRWSVDTEDEDKVLRIETYELITELDIIKTVKHFGYHCEVLQE